MTVNENIGTKVLAFDSYKDDSDVMWCDVEMGCGEMTFIPHPW